MCVLKYRAQTLHHTHKLNAMSNLYFHPHSVPKPVFVIKKKKKKGYHDSYSSTGLMYLIINVISLSVELAESSEVLQVVGSVECSQEKVEPIILVTL